MIYEPTIYNEHDWQRVNRLLLSDPVLYAWLHWETQAARDSLRKPFDFQRTDEPLFQDTVLWRARWGFSTGDNRAWSSFVVPPH